MKSTRPMASGFLDFIRLVVDGDVDEVSRRLARSGALASTPAGTEWIKALLREASAG
jgi:hypothetical protein